MTPSHTPTLSKILELANVFLAIPAESNDNFFAHGGDSLAALELTQQLQDAFALELSADIVFEAIDFLTLATAIDAAIGGSGPMPFS